MDFSQLYQKNVITNEYNPKVITKLLQNYRSHPSLLYLPNKLFYENELIVSILLAKLANICFLGTNFGVWLQSAADKAKIQCMCSWNVLPQKNFPIIFHGVKGKEDREGNSPRCVLVCNR